MLYHCTCYKYGSCNSGRAGHHLRVGLGLNEAEVELVGVNVKVAVEAGHAPPLRVRDARRHDIRPAILRKCLIAGRRRELVRLIPLIVLDSLRNRCQ